MRIGELLVEQRKLDPSDLSRTLGEQAAARRRLASLLIARGLVDFDDASRALGQQLGVPCALAKHLENRDPALADAIPEELGRASCALPIGRTSGGDLIVCVRDPSAALHEALEAAAHTDVLVIVAPATRLEHLVNACYGASPTEEFDVDVESSAELPPLPDLDALDPDSVRLALTDLDDDRVAKDPTQSGQNQLVRPAASRTPPTGQPRVRLPPAAPPLVEVLRALEGAGSRDAATERALEFLAGRWVACLIVAIRGSNAIGYRGHGVQVRGGVDGIVLPLALPSTIQRAHQSRRPTNQAPAGPAQDQVNKLLGFPSSLAAAPVLVGGEAVAVIAVGDPVDGAGEVARASEELGVLARALGVAYERIRRG